jgi:hypothetical protein
MTIQPDYTYRYERKFLVDVLDVPQVRLLLRQHPSMFYQTYPPRYVNNLYLDTKELSNYHANLSGVGDRRKVRIRWYGPLFGDVARPVLEIKVKRGLVGRKYSFPFTPFRLDENFTNAYYSVVLQNADLPAFLKKSLMDLDVVLCNRYQRWYYATKDQRFRATVDGELSYYRVDRLRNHFRHRHVDGGQVVLELKYARPLDAVADRVAGFFPFIMAKNSKYITGIEMVYL